MKIQEDKWLSEIFSHPVFKIAAATEAAAAPKPYATVIRDELARHSQAQTVAMYYAKVDAREVEIVQALGAAGLYVVDVNVVFGNKASAFVESGAKASDELSIAEIRPEEHEEVLYIAENSFRYSRFHLDPGVSLEIANRIKRDWIANYIRGHRGDHLFAASLDGHAVGFLAALRSETEYGRTATIDLVGVHPDFQKRGIGGALTAAFIDYYRDSCEWLQVGTQVANIPSMKLYQRMGFYISGAQYVMHMHVQNR